MTVKTFEALASGETLELRIYGPIGSGDPLAAMFGIDIVSADSVERAIRQSSGHKRIVVKFNSPGGSAFDGMAIRAILAEQTCETVGVVQGLAGSAASIAIMGCKRVEMHIGSMLMIHEARLISHEPMDALELKRSAASIEALNESMASVYSQRTGKTIVECRKLMAAETWLTADKAVSEKFADEMVGESEDVEALKVAASFDLSVFGYQHVPAKFAASASRQLTIEDVVRAVDERIAAKAAPSTNQLSGLRTGSGSTITAHHGYTANGTAPSFVTTGTQPAYSVDWTYRPSTSAEQWQHMHVGYGTSTTPSQEETDRFLEAMRLLQSNVPQPSAASTNAEASASRKRDSMTIKLIAAAAGLSADADESAVVAAVSQLHAFVGELKTLTKASTFDALLGTVRGLQASAAQVEPLKATIAEQTKQLEDQKRASIIAADKTCAEGRRLTPATEAFWATQPVAALEAFMAAASPIVVVETAGSRHQQQQPAGKTEAVSGSKSTDAEVLTHNGLAWEQMEPIAKAELHDSNPERYEALKRNHAERGSPRAQSQQQRASA